MEELLVPVKTTATHSKNDRQSQSSITKLNQEPPTSLVEEIQSPEQALNILQSRPSQEVLSNVLRWLYRNRSIKNGFNIDSQTPQAAQIIYALVNNVLPDHWTHLRDNSNRHIRKMRDLVISVLSNVAGVSAITTRMRFVIGQKDNVEDRSQVRSSGRAGLLEETLSILESVLAPDNFVLSTWSSLTASSPNNTRRGLLWKELAVLLGNGKVLSTASEANDIVAKDASTVAPRSWLSDGSRYSSWIGQNLNHFLAQSKERNDDLRKAWAQMLERALTIGHADQLVEAVYGVIIHGDNQSITTYQEFTMALKDSTRKTVLYSLLRVIAKIHLNSPSVLQGGEANVRIGDVAALLHDFIRNQEDLLNNVREWLSSDGVLQDLQIRRAVIAALADGTEILKTALLDSLNAFGDKMRIKHAPILHQEGTTENLLLLAGYVYRKDPQYVAEMSRSSLYLKAISNRLAASSPRASMLGMYVGTAISELVDPVDKRMSFSSEELTNAQGKRYLGLTKLQNRLGLIEDLKRGAIATKATKSPAKKTSAVRQVTSVSRKGQAGKTSKIISIEELESESNSEDDDLPLYAKSDSDASDSDEDPTVINRDKPTAPVYINDLISSLRDNENYDRHTLALTHASALIRRKASFGSEVTDNIQDLASILTGLSDRWNLDNFQELRLQAMIAVLVAQPLEMGQWFSRTYFNGDYSISQRAAVLTTLGLGARELAGHGEEDAALTKSNQVSKDTAFPSKQLPPKLHALYASEGMAPLTSASKQLEQSILRPMALNAADALTGPNALKIRTFSSRMEVEKKRTKPIPNALAKVVADGFFLPLTGRWSMHIQG
ncbi:MAG: hypothetical protein Q9225_004329, partial [Loekoesia sp. 1 TL-2023]